VGCRGDSDLSGMIRSMRTKGGSLDSVSLTGRFGVSVVWSRRLFRWHWRRGIVFRVSGALFGLFRQSLGFGSGW
jgi:hypothetical protein